MYIVAQQVIGTEGNFLKIIDAVGIAAIDLAVAEGVEDFVTRILARQITQRDGLARIDKHPGIGMGAALYHLLGSERERTAMGIAHPGIASVGVGDERAHRTPATRTIPHAARLALYK